MNPLQLVQMLRQTSIPENQHPTVLAAMADAPPEDYEAKVQLPVQNELPAYKIGSDDLGHVLSGQNYGVAAPVPGQKATAEPSIGQLLIGENNGGT